MVRTNAMARPMPQSKKARLAILRAHSLDQEKLNLRSERYVVMPMMNMNEGNTRSVGVRPNQSA